jgi:hypothetical protein
MICNRTEVDLSFQKSADATDMTRMVITGSKWYNMALGQGLQSLLAKKLEKNFLSTYSYRHILTLCGPTALCWSI